MKSSLFGFAIAAVMTLASIVAPSKAAANYLNNGSFETGDFTGWTSGGNFEFTQVVTGPFYVYSAAEDGNFYVTGGPVGADATLSQTFSDTVGQTLNVSGWVNANGDDPSDLVFYFDGTALFSATDPVTDGWTDLSFLVTATGSDTFAVGFRDDPAYIALDNFSVESTATPLPSAWTMMLIGLAGLGFIGFRGTKNRSPAPTTA